jgi:hypothetical protein
MKEVTMRTYITLATLVAITFGGSVLGEEAESPVYQHLEDLECFIGDWEATAILPDGTAPSDQLGEVAGKQVVLKTSVRWAPGKCAQIIDVTYQIEGVVLIKGTAIRAWDQDAKQIREYQFTTHKGVWTGTWKKDGGSWIHEYRGKNLDSRVGTGKRVISFSDENNYVIKDINRTLAGKPQPAEQWKFKRI